MSKIIVVTLCGSRKFVKEFKAMETELTLNGLAVLSPVFFEESQVQPLTQEALQQLKEIHLRKIELADEIFVMDVDGYIGESTRKEIAFAQKNHKVVRYYSAFLSSHQKGEK